MQMKSKMMWALPLMFILNVSIAQSISKDALSKTMKITIPYQWTSVFSLGFKVNMNTTFRNYDQHYLSNRATYSVNSMSASTVFEWQFSRCLSIGVEPSYVRNIYYRYNNSIIGTLGFDCGNSYPSDLDLNTNYFVLPILLKARFPVLKNKILISSEIGWNSIWLVNTEKMGNGSLKFSQLGKDEYSSLYINPFDHGLNVGIGFSIPLKKGFIDVNTRYYMGRKDVTHLYDSKTQILTYQLGYRFIL
jgi:hypothetical protein